MQSVQNINAAQGQGVQAVQGIATAQGQGVQAAQQAIQAAQGKAAHGMQQAAQGLQDIHDIKPPVLVGIDPLIFKAAVALIATVCFLVAGYLLFRYLKNRLDRGKNKSLSLLPPPPPADQAALAELVAIADLMVAAPRLYYFRLTSILKTFIGKIFHINAPEMTTQEIIAAINTLSIEREMVPSAREFFLSSSMVKYAAMEPEMVKMKSDEDFVRRFIDSVVKSISIESALTEKISMDKSMATSINKISQRGAK